MQSKDKNICAKILQLYMRVLIEKSTLHVKRVSTVQKSVGQQILSSAVMDLVLLAIFVASILALLLPFLKRIKKQLKFNKLLNAIPGPRAYPLVGSTLPFLMASREGKGQ